MSIRHVTWALAALLVATAGCDDIFGDGGPEPVRLRVENRSVLAFDVVALATLDGRKSWSDVGSGETTSYVEVSASYGIVSTEVVVGTDTLRLQVIDYLGEDYLEAGNYTFLLDVSGPFSESPSLTQVLRRDD